MTRPSPGQLRSLTTPRAAALAGVVFALLFAVVLVALRLPDPTTGRLRLTVVLMPFSGIAFLWFIGVIRDSLGWLEDRFFSTVFLGSGLLFLAMVFAGTAVQAGLLAAKRSGGEPDPQVAAFAHGLLVALTNTYALRMAAVFMMSLATIWLRTGLMARWLVVATYLVAVSVLVAGDISPWMTLTFPAWVLGVSLLMLRRRPAGPTPLPDTG
ncbi:hypothetical protein FK535_26390 [Mycolicibacterium sp. 018/SC-01/001]|uniref:hypothetical protein n=1 Tax=Mycolicibacterium sp. 018/SC-01/001 TaxID=2592069 RepID=UPI00117E994B|nr:hypothetical protein [Mycolicibacterium sp. 018/SC-01/001]TRW77830.1 hypothetical protein FK535_26390 [Mycolicibacterium sp. 018/SC-01/001]